MVRLSGYAMWHIEDINGRWECKRPQHVNEEEEEPLLIYTAQGSPFRRKKLSVINGSPEQQRTKTH